MSLDLDLRRAWLAYTSGELPLDAVRNAFERAGQRSALVRALEEAEDQDTLCALGEHVLDARVVIAPNRDHGRGHAIAKCMACADYRERLGEPYLPPWFPIPWVRRPGAECERSGHLPGPPVTVSDNTSPPACPRCGTVVWVDSGRMTVDLIDPPGLWFSRASLLPLPSDAPSIADPE